PTPPVAPAAARARGHDQQPQEGRQGADRGRDLRDRRGGQRQGGRGQGQGGRQHPAAHDPGQHPAQPHPRGGGQGPEGGQGAGQGGLGGDQELNSSAGSRGERGGV